jgi:hypothetical protein
MWLIGLDDTDLPDTRGTGQLARMLAAELADQGIRPRGVTRHQLLVDPRVPYTARNSANCVAIEGAGNPAALFEWACDFVRARSPQGADPGVCLARAGRVSRAVIRFGRRTQMELVNRRGAARIAEDDGCRLAGLAGTRDGVIGALAAVGLRASGCDGRFVGLGRLRDLQGVVTVQELLDAGAEGVAGPDGQTPESAATVETLDWVRPRLAGGRPVLLVQRSERHGVDWIVSDRPRSGGKARGG